MKNRICWGIVILLVSCFVFAGSSAFACSGGSSGGSGGSTGRDGGEGLGLGTTRTSDATPTGVKSNGPVMGAYGIVLTPQQIKEKWDNVNRINKYRNLLGYFQAVETMGDFGNATAQYGPWLYWKYYGEKVFYPFALTWQTTKHGFRTVYGIAYGRLETVQRVNRGINGWLSNTFVVRPIRWVSSLFDE